MVQRASESHSRSENRPVEFCLVRTFEAAVHIRLQRADFKGAKYDLDALLRLAFE